MTVIFDACSLINLTNGQVLPPVLRLGSYVVGPIVSTEIDLQQVEKAVCDGQISRLDDSHVSADQFLSLVEEHHLGDGESECIAAAIHLGYTVCTDDGKARTVAAKLLGSSRLTGSLGLLRNAVLGGFLPRETADVAYRKMLVAGGFLPQLPARFFEPTSSVAG